MSEKQVVSLANKIVILLILSSLLLTFYLVGQRALAKYLNNLTNQALAPVSANISDLQQALLAFEQDLTNLKNQSTGQSTATVATSIPAAAPTSTAATASASPASAPAAIPAANESGLININTATLGQLDSLPGIGASYAQRIIEARPFVSVDDLNRVKGVGSKTIERLRPLITL